MPAKKAADDERVLLGRPTNNVKIGLVGLPNVGKSSLFNLLQSSLQVPAENYPFCTIDPATASVQVPDERFDHLTDVWQCKSIVGAVLAVTDIAGLVKGASEGKGLGNNFLANIQAVDAIYHVTRAFVKKDVEHVEGTVDPVRDFGIIKQELIAKDLEWVNGHLDALKKKTRHTGGDNKEVKLETETCDKLIENLKEGKETRHIKWNNKEIELLNKWPLLTAKPAVYLVNVSTANFKDGKNKWFADIKKWVSENSPGEAVVPYSITFEQELAAMTPEARTKFLAESKSKSMLPRVILAGYKALNLIHYFTTGVDEVRAWSVRKGAKAPAAAGVIHGDFEKFFISADQYNYTDFKEYGSEAAVKAAGKIRSQGKEYVVQDGDIMFFKHNAGGANKKKK